MTEEEQLAAEFETHRPYLHAIAFRVLGSHADADDAVQEAWLRLARTGGGGIEDLRGWLTTVTGRICLDVLRRRGARGEEPLELNVGMLSLDAAADSRTSPEEEALLADSVGLALYVVMDALTPGVPRGGRPGRHRGAARRARPRGRTPGNRPSGGRRRMRRGPDRKPGEGGRAPGCAGPSGGRYGLPGILITVDGRPVTVLAFTIANSAVTAIRALTDPDRLAQIVPSWVA